MTTDVRTRILSEATRRFAHQGVDATSLQEIADAVGVRKPSLLYHFPSKEALHARVLEHLLAHWSETVPRLLHAAAREDRFDALFDEMVSFFAADPDRARLLLREAIDRPAELRALVRVHASAWLGLIADSVRAGQGAGVLRADVDPEAYLLHVIQLVIGSFAVGPLLAVLLPATAPASARATAAKATAKAGSKAAAAKAGRARPLGAAALRRAPLDARMVREMKRMARAALVVTPPPSRPSR